MKLETRIAFCPSADMSEGKLPRPLLMQFSTEMFQFYSRMAKDETVAGSQSRLIETVDMEEASTVVERVFQGRGKQIMRVELDKWWNAQTMRVEVPEGVIVSPDQTVVMTGFEKVLWQQEMRHAKPFSDEYNDRIDPVWEWVEQQIGDENRVVIVIHPEANAHLKRYRSRVRWAETVSQFESLTEAAQWDDGVGRQSRYVEDIAASSPSFARAWGDPLKMELWVREKWLKGMGDAEDHIVNVLRQLSVLPGGVFREAEVGVAVKAALMTDDAQVVRKIMGIMLDKKVMGWGSGGYYINPVIALPLEIVFAEKSFNGHLGAVDRMRDYYLGQAEWLAKVGTEGQNAEGVQYFKQRAKDIEARAGYIQQRLKIYFPKKP